MTSATSSKPLALLAGLAGVAVTGLFDYATGYEVRVFPLYFLPVALVAWKVSRTGALALALTSAVTWVVANGAAGRVYSSPLIWPINFLSMLIAFGVVGVLVAELQKRLVAVESLSRQDALTTLPNSRAFHERAELLLAVARRSSRPLTLAYLDLDNFKQVNDEGGHQEGDRALKATADVLKTHFRGGDLVARLGGDEFAILLPDTGPDGARRSLERVRDLVSAAMQRHRWPVTVSVGAVAYERAPATLGEAVEQADALMYRAKKSGKDRVHVEVAEPAGEALGAASTAS